MNTRVVREKLHAAKDLFSESTTTFGAIRSVSTLVRGAHKDVDRALSQLEQAMVTFEKVDNGEVVELSVEQLPERTDEQKKRKRALLLLISTWKTLGSEIKRVEAELANLDQSGTASNTLSVWGRVFKVVKGPLGITTIVAVAIVVTMQQTSVSLVINNEGCPTLYASGGVPFAIPGLSLPKDPIVSGGSGKAVLPPLTVTVDGTSRNSLSLKALSFNTTFALPSNIVDVTLNGVSMLGRSSTVALLDKDEHEIVLICR